MKKTTIVFLGMMMFFSVFGNFVNGAESGKFKLLMIDSQDAEPYTTLRHATVDELKRLGYEEGKNLEITYYSLAHHLGRSKSIWLREADRGHDVIYVNGTMATIAFRDRALGDENHKFVFCAVTDPVDVGVIENFTDPPKYNFTGVSYPIPIKKRFEFIREVMPEARKVGYIFSDMPQSYSYKKWIENLIADDPEFQDYILFPRMVEFIAADQGSRRMALEAIPHIRELNDKVDLYLSPSDQLGTQEPYAQTIFEYGTKPLVGIGGKDVLEEWGATMTIFTSLEGLGQQAAHIIHRIFQGTPFKEIIPEQPKNIDMAYDMKKLKKFGIRLPLELLEAAGDNIIE